MSLTATARSIPGTLRQEVVVDGQHRLITDERSASAVTGAGRRGRASSRPRSPPCVSTTLVMHARTKT